MKINIKDWAKQRNKVIASIDKHFEGDCVRGKEQVLEIEPARKSRSLNANAYLWVLCDKIAEVIFATKDEVCRNAVREVGVFIDRFLSHDEYLEHKERWERIGMGWFCDEVSRDEEGIWFLEVYGSSVYNTAQMTRLIEYVIEEAKALDIETKTPDEIAEMLSLMESRGGAYEKL